MPAQAAPPPMEATSVDAIPAGPEWQYEPKWDGFRCLVFRRRRQGRAAVQGRQAADALFPRCGRERRRRFKAKQFVLDGEIVVPRGRRVLVRRPAAAHPSGGLAHRKSSRSETPALLIAFDLLGGRARQRAARYAAERRGGRSSKTFAASNFRGDGVRLSPATTKLSEAKGWLKKVGATLDGIIAKRRDAPYAAGTRDAMVKVKNYRSADCVVGGFRYGTNSKLVGSLLLGLYDDDGTAASCRLHVIDRARREGGAHREARKAQRRLRLHRQCAGRAEPLVDRALGRMGAAQAEARGRGLLRPFLRRAFPPRHAADALASRQGAASNARWIR